MNNLYSITHKRFVRLGSLICLALFMNACATFKTPQTINETPVHARALTKEANGIRVSVAVVSDQEARQMFGIDLGRKRIQAVWLKVENSIDRPVLLLPTAIDPAYFAPLEVAHAYHRSLAAEANAALDAHLLELNFPIRSPIRPGERASGYIFTNLSKGLKVIDVDLLGNDFSQNFTFFAPNPDSPEGPAILDHIETMFSASELQKVAGEAALRETLEQLPCCVSIRNEGPPAEPLNVVIIGTIDDWTTAFVRRGYQYQVLSPRYAFGRVQDISGKKRSNGYTIAQAHSIRLWQTPIRYQGKPVWVGQISTRLGGRFADEAPAEVTLPLNPAVDEARDDITQDLAYSQALINIGYIQGSGDARSATAEEASKDLHYRTDGLRVVLVFGDRPSSLEGIDFFNWEQLADHR